MQRAEQELARGNSDAALRQYELVKTWSPTAAEGPIQACLADGAWLPVAQPVRPQASADPEVGSRLPRLCRRAVQLQIGNHERIG